MKGTFLAVLMLAGVAAAQTSYPPPPPGRQTTSQPRSSAVAAPPATPADASQLLSQLGQTSSALNASLAGLRIDKWKTGGAEKNQLQSDAESIRRNLNTALPGIMQDVHNAPGNLAANFKLYRNVSALYDVLSPLTQAAEALGPQSEFRDLSQQLQSLDTVRHGLGERMAQLASAKDAEIARLGAQLKQAQAAIPPKKIVVDDNEEPKPKTKAKKKKPAATTAQTDSKSQQQ